MTAGRDAVTAFPRRSARSRRFTLGRPRAFTVSPDGDRVLFLRSSDGDDPVQRLWSIHLPSGEETCLADPVAIGADDGDLPPEERARRDRAREQAGGIVAYATDEHVRVAVFALAGRVYVCRVATAQVDELDVAGPAIDPRPDPTGHRLAWVAGGALHVAALDGGDVRAVAGEAAPDVTWGLPEFIASEEMGRTRGYWWAPDGQRLAVARVDTAGVLRWHVADPVDPAAEPTRLAYPAAGTANADVSLHVVGLDGGSVPATWDRDAFPYLVDVVWQAEGPLAVVVQSRDQRTMQLRAVDADTGATEPISEQRGEPWLEVVPGVPRWLPDGRLVTAVDDVDADTRRVAIDGDAVSPPGLHVRRVVDVSSGGVVIAASGDDPTAIGLWRVRTDGAGVEALTPPAGVFDAVVRGGTRVISGADLGRSGAQTRVHWPHGDRVIDSRAWVPGFEPRVQLLQLGARGLRGALVLPADHRPDDEPLPVLLDPYGGPHAQLVLQSRTAFATAQWFAEQGFAVLVVDGRGSPGRGLAWEHAIAGDLAGPPLADQVEALRAAAEAHPVLDLGRVAIRGWSFGGYLATLALLRRPDVFSAAIAGAPVTDWRLYDTHYTERYLGHPDALPDVYERNSLLGDAGRLERPLLLIHGLADDNVVAAHSLRLSRALLEAGRPHTFLPLVGVTHMTPQEVVAENLLRLQLDFLRGALRPATDDRR